MSRRDTAERKRGTYLGSHEVAALVGANPWKSPADVYARCALGATSSQQTKAMARGLIVEHGLIAHASERLGPLVRDVFYLDDDHPFIGGSLDGLTEDGQALVEVTTCSENTRGHWGPSEIGSPSPLKQVQVQYFLGLSGAKRAEVFCLDMASDELLHYVVEPDPEAIATLRATAIAFWQQHVVPKVPPHVMDGWGTSEHLDLVWPGPPAGTVVETEATDELKRWAAEYDHARAVAKDADERKQKARDQLHALIGNASLAKWDGGKVSLSSAKLEDKIDWAQVATTLRDELRIPGPVFAAAVEQCTHARHSQRRIDVRMTKEKNSAK